MRAILEDLAQRTGEVTLVYRVGDRQRAADGYSVIRAGNGE
jgi:hypothetical protein